MGVNQSDILCGQTCGRL